MGIEAVVGIEGKGSLAVGSFTAPETVTVVIDTVDIAGVVDSKSITVADVAVALMASAMVVTIPRSFSFLLKI